jgi:hypothetical protein
MVLPHALFVASAVAVKLLIPSVLRYFATQTYATVCLSTLYPLLWTIALVHSYKQQQESASPYKTPTRTTTATTRRAKTSKPSQSSIPSRTTQSRSTIKSVSTPVQRWIQAVTPGRRRKQQQQQGVITIVSMQREEATFWLHYWMVMAMLTCVSRMIYGTPIMGRLLARSSWISVWLQEVQLVFFVWLLCFPSILTSAASGDEKKSLESRPLPLLYNYLSPYLLPVYNAVSNVVPESLWKTVCDNVQSILSLAVTIRLLSEERSATLVQILQESRAVLPPAVTLFMLGFVTQYGVLYVRLILPTAKQQQNNYHRWIR